MTELAVVEPPERAAEGHLPHCRPQRITGDVWRGDQLPPADLTAARAPRITSIWWVWRLEQKGADFVRGAVVTRYCHPPTNRGGAAVPSSPEANRAQLAGVENALGPLQSAWWPMGQEPGKRFRRSLLGAHTTVESAYGSSDNRGISAVKRWSSFFSRHSGQRNVGNDGLLVQPEKIGILRHPPTQAPVQEVNDGPVASVTLLDEICAAMVGEGMVKGAVKHPSFPCPD